MIVDGRAVGAAEAATGRRERARGLLGRDGLDGALVLSGIRSVHTVGMRFAIDVAWLDRDGVVLRCRTMPSGRVSRVVLRARAVVEAEAGSFAAWGLDVGASVTVETVER